MFTQNNLPRVRLHTIFKKVTNIFEKEPWGNNSGKQKELISKIYFSRRYWGTIKRSCPN